MLIQEKKKQKFEIISHKDGNLVLETREIKFEDKQDWHIIHGGQSSKRYLIPLPKKYIVLLSLRVAIDSEGFIYAITKDEIPKMQNKVHYTKGLTIKILKSLSEKDKVSLLVWLSMLGAKDVKS